MPAIATSSDLPRRLGAILSGLRQVVAVRASRDQALAAMLLLLWNRLSRTLARVSAIAARYRAGRLRAPPTAGHRAAAPGRPPPRDPLPRQPAWVLQLAPECAAYAENLRWLLAEPELAAMVAAAPQLRRLLRPLWRMLQPGPPPPLLQAPRTPKTSPSGSAAGPRQAEPDRTEASPPAPPMSSPGPLWAWAAERTKTGEDKTGEGKTGEGSIQEPMFGPAPKQA